ncbi:hypothetical protein BDV26DRAFT_292608 [Aspergillus bertholletiae]|uniref:Uncharacterized protein n=1 Tax=Aspergillus bertholletiae TaxID=1226010 RepID=A0A5N7B8B7_9EURO|nr:hypothetical protein BDV26DRAFT_292608 [Aspergillus bertholletiae]
MEKIGDLNVPPPPSDVKGVPDTSDADEYQLLKGLCNFACSRDYCPPGACRLASESGDDEYDDDSDDNNRPTEIIVDGSIWHDINPAVSCGSSCILVLPPVTLPSPTVITFDNDQGGYQTTLNVAWDVAVTTTLPDGQVVATSSISHIPEFLFRRCLATVSVLPLWPVTISSPIPTITIYPMYRIPPQTIAITDDPNPLSVEGVSHLPITRDVIIPPYPWVSESARDNKIPPVTFTSASDSSNGPKCTNRARCGSGCHSKHFCDGGPCLIGCGGGGFAAPNDPKPLPNPHPGRGHNDNDNDDDNSQTCTTTATVTDLWVSCSTINPSSTSCTTTSSHVHSGCRATASATTTGVSDICRRNSRDEDQDSDGGAGSGLITTIDEYKSTTTTATKTTATPKTIPTRSVQQGVLTCQ